MLEGKFWRRFQLLTFKVNVQGPMYSFSANARLSSTELFHFAQRFSRLRRKKNESFVARPGEEKKRHTRSHQVPLT